MRQTQFLCSVQSICLVSIISMTACAPELEISAPIDPNSATVAQFDPTNPVPILQLVPVPTALAQNQDGPGLNVSTYGCEGATTKQCLKYVDGWPTTTPISLYFSGPLDPETISDGIRLLGREGGIPSFIDFTVTSSAPRAPPSAECLAGNNGTQPSRSIDPSEIPPGIELVITPSRPLLPNSDYIILVESHPEGGLRDAKGNRVEPSSLFSVLNFGPDNPPVEADGTVNNALLRQNLRGLVLAGLYPSKQEQDLSDDERQKLEAAIQSRALDLYDLYDFFNQVIEPLQQLEITSRDKLILVNAWQTGPEPVEIAFDPLQGVLPFPNNELLTVSTDASNPNSIHDVRVNLPVDGSSTASAAYAFLNTRTGFSTTSPILIPLTGAIDPATLSENVMMYPVSPTGMVDGQNPAAISAQFLEGSSATGPSISITPVIPLSPNTTYVVGLKQGILAEDGSPVVANSTFRLLTTPIPLINQQNEVLSDFRPILQCSTLETTGQLATEQEVIAAAIALEDRLLRSRWQSALEAFEMLSPAVPRTELLIAFSVRTQDVTSELDALFTSQGMGSAFDAWKAYRATQSIDAVQGPVQTITGTAAVYQHLQIAEQICSSLCLGGFTEVTDCTNEANAPVHPLYDDAVCQTVMSDFAGNIYELRQYQLRGFGLTSGNPLNPSAGFFDINKLTGNQAIDLPILPVWVALGREAATTSSVAYPATIFQHGLARTSTDGFGVADSLIAAGQVVVMMDLPWHGDRASDLVDNATGLPCVDDRGIPNVDPIQACNTSTVTGARECYPAPLGCDGLRDSRGVGFIGPNLFASRDNLRQMVIDHLTLLDAMANEPSFGFVNARDISFLGTSLGASVGGNIAAYTDGFSSMVLNAPGGGITNILLGAPQFFSQVFQALSALGVCELVDQNNPAAGCKDTNAFRQFLYAAQWIVDLGDPLAHSSALGTERGDVKAMDQDKILVQMMTPDNFIIAPTTQALGRSYGLDPADNSETSKFQTFEFSQDYQTDAAHQQLTGGTGCHTSLIAPVCGGKKFVANIPGIDFLPGSESLIPGLELVGNVCGTAALQGQAVGFIASGGTNIGLRTSSFPPGIQGLIDQQLANFPVMLNLECPTF